MRIYFWQRCVVAVYLFLQATQQFPQPVQPEKRFNIETMPGKNGTILLRLKSHHGSPGSSGPMGDQGPPGNAGPPGTMGQPGAPGYCAPEICDTMENTRSLVSRVEQLEKLAASRELSRDQGATADRPVVAVHITSDIYFNKGNNASSAKSLPNGLPRNINLNIALKNLSPKVDGTASAELAPGHVNRKFLYNSTVFIDPGTGNQLKSGIATPSPSDRESITERQFQPSQYGAKQNEVPSIKKDNIPRA